MLAYFQALMIVAKLDKFFNWDWDKVLWTYWIYFSVISGISLGCFLIFLGKLYQNAIIKLPFYKSNFFLNLEF